MWSEGGRGYVGKALSLTVKSVIAEISLLVSCLCCSVKTAIFFTFDPSRNFELNPSSNY